MKIFIAAACATMAALYVRLSQVQVEIHNARKALADARAVEGDVLRSFDAARKADAVLRLQAVEQVVVEELRELTPGFQWILQNTPAANDDHFGPRAA